MAITIPELSLNAVFGRPVSYHFAVIFLVGGVLPNPLDIRFSKVSGLSSTIGTEEINEGGENLFTHKIPTKVTYGDLTLTRGLAIGSLLNIEFNVAMSVMKFLPSNVIITALDGENLPVPGANWLLMKAYPTSWSVSDLDANDNNLVIDTMTLTYARLQHIRF